VRALAFGLFVWLQAWGATVRESQIGLAASETACAVTRPESKVDASAEQVFFRFVVKGIGKADRLRIDWIDPRGQISTSVPYDELPRAAELCFVSALPVGGFAPSTQPGTWRARVVVNNGVVHERAFEITGVASSLTARVAQVNENELVIDARGAISDTSINIAKYSPSGGWSYIAPTLAERMEGSRIWAKIPKLQPAEYLVILRNPDGTQSPPARFVIATESGYRMPVFGGETWRISQGPHGSYSHWGRALHAYDVSPVNARWVAAMRGGTVRAYDLGLGQTPQQRIFGNYITIAHDDGEFSHYAHLRTGTFQVKTGQRVEAGDVLAEVGTSGYSFGRHIHVHVTEAASISAQSVPFRFEKNPAVITRFAAPPKGPGKNRWTGEAGFAEWWSRLVQVPRGTRSLAVKLGWEDKTNLFDLYVVSPSGRTYKPESEAVRIDGPEPGQWRVSVQGVKSGGGGMTFWVEPEVTPGGK